MAIGSAASEPFTGEGFGVATMLATLTVSAAAAWKWERWGGAAEVAAALAFGVFVYVTAGSNQLIVALLLPSPWFLSGVLFLALSRTRQEEASL
jgi:hypothetical protein